ncbi:hypothetical protein AAVH_14296 [Aphelenchoides avenae]|nr:hypothetical protein AAVH_14296 [Aphelenchus avenae]
MASVAEAEKFVILGEFLCYMIHFIGGYYFVKRVSAVSLMHPNLRLLMCNLVIEFTLIGIGRIGDCIVELAMPFGLPRTAACVLFKVVQDTGVQIAGLTFVWIALERLMATLLIHTYEQKTSTVGKVIVAIAYGAALTSSIAVAVVDVITTDWFDSSLTESCQTSTVHTWIVPLAVLVMTFFYTAIILLIIGLYKYNMRMKQLHKDACLAARYQYSENVATLAVLVPSIIAWGACLLLAFPLLPWYWNAWTSGDRPTQIFINQVAEFFRIMFLLAAVNSIGCPLAFMLKYGPLNAAFVADLRRLSLCKEERRYAEQSSSIQNVVVTQVDRHFRELQEIWWNKP